LREYAEANTNLKWVVMTFFRGNHTRLAPLHCEAMTGIALTGVMLCNAACAYYHQKKYRVAAVLAKRALVWGMRDRTRTANYILALSCKEMGMPRYAVKFAKAFVAQKEDVLETFPSMADMFKHAESVIRECAEKSADDDDDMPELLYDSTDEDSDSDAPAARPAKKRSPLKQEEQYVRFFSTVFSEQFDRLIRGNVPHPWDEYAATCEAEAKICEAVNAWPVFWERAQGCQSLLDKDCESNYFKFFPRVVAGESPAARTSRSPSPAKRGRRKRAAAAEGAVPPAPSQAKVQKEAQELAEKERQADRNAAALIAEEEDEKNRIQRKAEKQASAKEKQRQKRIAAETEREPRQKEAAAEERAKRDSAEMRTLEMKSVQQEDAEEHLRREEDDRRSEEEEEDMKNVQQEDAEEHLRREEDDRRSEEEQCSEEELRLLAAVLLGERNDLVSKASSVFDQPEGGVEQLCVCCEDAAAVFRTAPCGCTTLCASCADQNYPDKEILAPVANDDNDEVREKDDEVPEENNVVPEKPKEWLFRCLSCCCLLGEIDACKLAVGDPCVGLYEGRPCRTVLSFGK